jgi:hypothetical protein
VTQPSALRESDTLAFMRVPMAKYSTQGVLDTRSRGADARWDIERRLATSCDDEALVMDFEGVRAVTVPFVEECVGKLLAGRAISYYDDHPVLAINANDDVRDTVAVALANRRLALLHASGPPMLLGGDDILNSTLRVAWPMQHFTANEVADRLGISAQAANNRLKALVARGALHRALTVPAGGGKEFAYTVPEPEVSPARATHKRPATRRRATPRPTHA